MIDATAQIHRLALVEDAQIGAHTRVWQFASVIRGARLGADCSVGAGANVDGCVLGDHCSIGHGASLHPGLVVGHEVFIGPRAVVCNDPWPRVRKGDFDAAALRTGFVCVRIGYRASVGASAIVLPGNSIGEGAMIAAGAVVDRNVPPWHLLKRSGAIVPIHLDNARTRMREAA